jgi:hypothetical protein
MDYNECIDYLESLPSNAISIFIGAGISKGCGLPTWDELVAPYVKELNVSSQNISYERILQYALSGQAQYNRFLSQLKGKISKAKASPIHQLIARLDVPRLWTTNYDGLIESSYREQDTEYQLVAKDTDLYSLSFEMNQIIKMHGSLTNEKETDIVLLESEYEYFNIGREQISRLFQMEILSKTILYMGVSFNDYNIRRIVSSIWLANREENRAKASFLFTVPQDTSYYHLWKNDLSRYNIEVIELKDFTEINTFLFKLLEKRYGKTAVILGKRKDDKYIQLSKIIGYKLAKNGYKIHTGGGPYISKSIVEGAWQYLEENNIPIEDKVVHFYREKGGSTNPQKGKVIYYGNTYSDLRKKMITPDKICILLGEESLGESGIQEEIQLAIRKGAHIVPVACTGSTAMNQWKIGKTAFDKGNVFSEKLNDYNNLCEDDFEKVANSVVSLSDYLLSRNIESNS